MPIAIPQELESRLAREASRRGVDPSVYAIQLIEHALSQATSASPPAPPNQATLELLARWEREQTTDDAEELARRQRDFEEFKTAMNRNRLESEGSDARIPYP